MLRVVFFGTPQFAALVLQYLIEHHIHIVAAIAKPDKPQGRSKELVPVPVKQVAQQFNIPVYQPQKVSAPDFFQTLHLLNADLFVVVAYGEIIKQEVLDLPKLACINLHASLLPKFRGAAPIQRAIIEGETETGVTIMHMVKKMDAGDMILQVKTPITSDMTYGELSSELQKIGAQALLKVILAFEETGNPRISQNEALATLAPKIELEDCIINWSLPAKVLHNLIRGVNPEPGAWCFMRLGDQEKRLKIFRSRLHEEISLQPAQIAFDSQKRLLVGCGKGSLELLEVQLEGKKRMSARDFYHGLSHIGWTLI